MTDRDVVVVGGCGRVGLPLAVALADAGLRVAAFDVNSAAVARVQQGEVPFKEPGAEERLREGLRSGSFVATGDPAAVSGAEYVVIVIGTPIDEHLSPDVQAVPDAIAALVPRLRPGQMIVLRSTVYPGVTRRVEDLLIQHAVDVDVAFCPDRTAEGEALEEYRSLPQIVSARTPEAMARARSLFERLSDKVVEASPEEAELAKLFTSSWRYIKFAAVNQFFMIANDHGVDFERVRRAVITDYPRAADMPSPGFAAGPTLFKDAMQLAAFHTNSFVMGQASMQINEGLPLYLVTQLEKRFELRSMTVGILGMAFKAESDDIRSSLSYKLRRLLRYKAGEVLCHDPYVVDDEELSSLEDVLKRADVVVIGAPHEVYRGLSIDQPVVDVWNLYGGGVRV